MRLNYPSGRNALAPGVKSDLIAHLEKTTLDPKCRAIVITGAESTFSAGGDVKGMKDSNITKSVERLTDLQHIVRLIATAKKPMIAAVEGNAAGGGMSIAAACDVVIAAEDAKFSGAATKIGLIPDMGAVWFLRARMGVGAARYFLMTGNVLSAAEAAHLGLVEKVVANGTALSVAQSQAAKFAAASATALCYTKAAFQHSPSELEDALAFELASQEICFNSIDFQEGKAAFLEKRAPNFTDPA
ncbi:enoyl-CoA hydratase/isomerase family protein [Granulosicoccus antarcticus]|uniref:enoyl-CoA hydratase/isomerase family protein n=1 Tax=Granulosicoccus antarcticus TaxID=437505 RepID=UPI000B5A49DD|nr:enoyl-CoA hydratase/isomerase family protein [Granulosicoccus antarcticus]